MKDVLEDEEAFKNDQLRRVVYDDGQGYGSDNSYTITTTPVRLKSIGDPALKRSLPVGYETRIIAKEYGLSDTDIDKLISAGALYEYKGETPPKGTLELSYGVHGPEE